MDFENCLLLVYQALQRVNELRPQDEQVLEDEDLVLVGDEGLLDSLSLTTLILTLENQLLEQTGRDISLMEEADFGTLSEQFRTARTIAELIASKL